MQKPTYHFFLCNSFRLSGEPQGACNRKGASDLLQYLQSEIADRGIDAIVSTTSCLNVCQQGPILVIYPHEWWYFDLSEEKVDQILDALATGQAVPELLMA
ncbi:MAG: (2Fe-2S) ferredoxin domain-containing protein [Thermoguttaceae bacterium]